MRTLLLLLLASCGSVAAQNYGSVVITELMIDPTPVKGLPDAEYLELFNRSSSAISLKNWKLTTGTRNVILPDSIVPAQEYIILCARTALPLLQPFGRCIALSSLSLPNDGSTLSLFNSNGKLQFSVSYSSHWWPAAYRDGGYALEMVDISNYCNETTNWLVAQDVKGGTPGATNSVIASNPDNSAPVIEQTEVNSASVITLRFNERLDSNSVQGAFFDLPGRLITSKKIETPSFVAIQLSFDSPLLPEQTYELTASNLADCAGNLAREIKVPFGLPSEPDSGDIVLNEILFNPRANGVDFVEIYNTSSRYINLNGWKLGTIKDGIPDNLRPITEKDRIMHPFSFLAISSDSKIIEQQYPTHQNRNLLTANALPAYSNENGDVTLVDGKGKWHDYFSYSASYHSPFLTELKGVSLERVDSKKPAYVSTNWQSASAVSGYATPGYANSQGNPVAATDEITIEPEAFTPDGDGIDDVATFRYSQTSAGKRADLLIYDSGGRLVKTLLKNQVMGTTGTIEWDGTDDQGKLVRMGYYMVLIKTLDTSGTITTYKKRVVVALP